MFQSSIYLLDTWYRTFICGGYVLHRSDLYLQSQSSSQALLKCICSLIFTSYYRGTTSWQWTTFWQTDIGGSILHQMPWFFFYIFSFRVLDRGRVTSCLVKSVEPRWFQILIGCDKCQMGRQTTVRTIEAGLLGASIKLPFFSMQFKHGLTPFWDHRTIGYSLSLTTACRWC